MSVHNRDLVDTVQALRPMPARDFETSRRFYEELGFRSEPLSECLVEMRLGGFSFILQDYYVAQWADNFVFHMRVTDVHRWWDRMVSLNLADRFGVRATAPHAESRGLVADTIDPSGVLWRIAAPQASTVLAEPERAHC